MGDATQLRDKVVSYTAALSRFRNLQLVATKFQSLYKYGRAVYMLTNTQRPTILRGQTETWYRQSMWTRPR